MHKQVEESAATPPEHCCPHPHLKSVARTLSSWCLSLASEGSLDSPSANWEARASRADMRGCRAQQGGRAREEGQRAGEVGDCTLLGVSPGHKGKVEAGEKGCWVAGRGSSDRGGQGQGSAMYTVHIGGLVVKAALA